MKHPPTVPRHFQVNNPRLVYAHEQELPNARPIGVVLIGLSADGSRAFVSGCVKRWFKTNDPAFKTAVRVAIASLAPEPLLAAGVPSAPIWPVCVERTLVTQALAPTPAARHQAMEATVRLMRAHPTRSPEACLQYVFNARRVIPLYSRKRKCTEVPTTFYMVEAPETHCPEFRIRKEIETTPLQTVVGLATAHGVCKLLTGRIRLLMEQLKKLTLASLSDDNSGVSSAPTDRSAILLAKVSEDKRTLDSFKAGVGIVPQHLIAHTQCDRVDISGHPVQLFRAFSLDGYLIVGGPIFWSYIWPELLTSFARNAVALVREHLRRNAVSLPSMFAHSFATKRASSSIATQARRLLTVLLPPVTSKDESRRLDEIVKKVEWFAAKTTTDNPLTHIPCLSRSSERDYRRDTGTHLSFYVSRCPLTVEEGMARCVCPSGTMKASPVDVFYERLCTRLESESMDMVAVLAGLTSGDAKAEKLLESVAPDCMRNKSSERNDNRIAWAILALGIITRLQGERQ